MEVIPLPMMYMPSIHESELVAGKRWAVISISSESSGWPEITKTESCLGVLRLFFHDVDKPVDWIPNLQLFEEEHAVQILDFVKEMEDAKIDLLIVHCHAGASRSPAVCAAISEIYGGSSQRFFNQYVPNRRVYRKILEAHERRKYG